MLIAFNFFESWQFAAHFALYDFRSLLKKRRPKTKKKEIISSIQTPYSFLVSKRNGFRSDSILEKPDPNRFRINYYQIFFWDRLTNIRWADWAHCELWVAGLFCWMRWGTHKFYPSFGPVRLGCLPRSERWCEKDCSPVVGYKSLGSTWGSGFNSPWEQIFWNLTTLCIKW